MTNESPLILYVEDDENDIFLLQHAFQVAGLTNPVQVARDGQEAVDYLSGAGEYADRTRYPLPRLILLDLKLPRKPGLEVLQWLREHSELVCLPLIVFSSSAQVGDIERAYHLGANSFVVKPISVEERIQLARCIKRYWLHFHEAPVVCRADAVV